MVGPGDVLAGRYRIESAAGAGAVGLLFTARDENEEKTVLVMVPRTTSEVDRFERNVRGVEALSHPAIARVIERGEYENVPFALVEMGDAPSLDRILEDAGSLDVRRAIRIAMQILQGLDHAHAAGMTHGALSSSNVLVADGDRPRIAGFGLSIGGDPRDDLTAAGRLLDAMVARDKPDELEEIVDRAAGTTTPFATAGEMRRALEEARATIAAVEERDLSPDDEVETTVWPIPDARYDPAKLGRRVIAAMIVVALIAGAAFLWRVMTRAEELREQREQSPTPSMTTSVETLGLV